MQSFFKASVSLIAALLALACTAESVPTGAGGASGAGGSGAAAGGAAGAGMGGAGAVAAGGSPGTDAGQPDSAVAGAAGSAVPDSGPTDVDAADEAADEDVVDASPTDADAWPPAWCPEPPDAEAKARYATCAASTSEQSCLANGGTWHVAYCYESCSTVCDCPRVPVVIKGKGCPCERWGECESKCRCVFEPSDPALRLDLLACQAFPTQGICDVPPDSHDWYEIMTPATSTISGTCLYRLPTDQ